MQDDNRNKAVAGVYWMSFMSVANVIIKLIITMVLSRLLNPYEFGAVSAVQVVISFADIFWMMGVGPAIVQKKELSNSDITTGNILNIIFGISIYGLICFFTPLIADFVGIQNFAMLRVLSIIFIIHSISGVSESLLQKEMKFKDIGMINVISLFLYGISSIILAFLGYGAWSLVIAQLIQASSKTILSLIRRPIEVSIKFNKSSAKELMYFGTGFTLSRVFNNLANQGDYLVVNRTLGSSALGIYNRAYQLLLVPTDVIGTVMDKVLFPLLSKYQEKYDKLRYVYLNITASSALLAFPITIISLLMGDELIYIALGSNWSATVLPFRILITSLFFRMAYKISDSLVRSLGAVYKRLWIQVVYSIIVIIGAYIGKYWGISGVAVAVSIAIFLNFMLMTLLIKHLIKYKIQDLIQYLLPIVLISIIIGVISYFVTILLDGFAIALVRLIIVTLIVGILYALAFKFFIMKVMPKEFIEFSTTIIEITMKKIAPKNF